MKKNNNHKEYADQSSNTDKDITEALDRIITRARRENNALSKVLKKIDEQKASDN